MIELLHTIDRNQYIVTIPQLTDDRTAGHVTAVCHQMKGRLDHGIHRYRHQHH